MRRLRRLAFVMVLLLWTSAPGVLHAQRQLHWDALDVDARLDEEGVLEVVERHTMVFTGDWNGGERVFNVRPRQKLQFLGMERIDTASGMAQPLRETNVRPDAVDEFAWTDSRTLRWRSRLPSDRPFSNTRLVYVLRYRLSGVLLRDGEQYRIDHDFAFPDRDGPIARFSLNLALHPDWQPLGDVRERYTAGPLASGRSFVLTFPLRYAGSGSPIAIDTRRPPEIVQAVAAILGAFGVGVLVFFVREFSRGRFTAVSTLGIDTDWIEKQIVAYPAEVVGAAWDGSIGTAEVVALMARMTKEGKLESTAGSAHVMSLRLKVNRDTLEGHERALVDGLFFDGRTETSTAAVREHYKGKGFNPAQVITPQLDAVVKTVNPPGKARVSWLPSLVLFLAGAAMLATTASTMPEVREGAIVILFAFLFGSVLLQIPGWIFRMRMDWGVAAAVSSMIPAFLLTSGVAVFLWMIVGTGRIELPPMMIGGIAALAMCLSNMSINGLKSRQDRAAIAFRKRLTAGRRYFEAELEKPNPALRDSWYPWLLSFGLGKEVDAWSTRNDSSPTRSSAWDNNPSSSSTSTSSSSSSSDAGWTGGGGRSGGAGAGATWAAAAAGMAAGVAAPSSSGSSGGGGGSSGGGSSGGGGGGGW